MAPKTPKTLRLLSGREVKVVKAHYPMGKNIWRVEYEHADGHHKGCLAEWLDQFEEIEPKPLRSPNG